MTRIEINPNLRLHNGHTIAERADTYGPIRAWDQVAVFESTSGMVGCGWIHSFDRESVEVCVDWGSLHVPTGNRASGIPLYDGNLRLP